MKKSKTMKKRDKQAAPFEIPPGHIFTVSAEEAKRHSKEFAADLAYLEQQRFTLTTVRTWPQLFTLMRVDRRNSTEVEHSAFPEDELQQKVDGMISNLGEDDQPLYYAIATLSRLSLPSLIKAKEEIEAVMAPPDTSNCSNTACSDAPLWLRIVKTVIDLKDTIGRDLHQMRYFRDGREAKAKKRIKRRFAAAIDSWCQRGQILKPHGNSDSFPWRYGGKDLNLPLPLIAIDLARLFVEVHLDLPRKIEIRLQLEKHFSSLANRSDSYWHNVWTRSGLTNLGDIEPWELDQVRRHPKIKSSLRSVQLPSIVATNKEGSFKKNRKKS